MEVFPERMGSPGRLASIEFLILDAVYRGGGLWNWSCIGGFDDLSLAVSQSCQCRKTTTGLSQRAGRSFLPKAFINNLILKSGPTSKNGRERALNGCAARNLDGGCFEIRLAVNRGCPDNKTAKTGTRPAASNFSERMQ